MNTRHQSSSELIPRGVTAPAVIALALAALAAPCRADDAAELAAIWDDPVFQRQFVAGYGVNSDVEPRVMPDVIDILEKIRPLMARPEDLSKAEAILRKQIKPETSAILDFTLGGIYFQQEKLAEALACYQAAVAKFPAFRRAWRNLGLIHVRIGAPGGLEEAIRAFTRMIELGGGDAYSYGLLGFAYASIHDHQAAEAAYRNALLLQPANTEWRLGLTRCVYRQEKFEDAATLLEGLIERYPEKGEFWLLQAHTFLGMKQPLRAAENLEALDRLGQAAPDALYTLGDIYVSENLVDLAAGAYLRAIEAGRDQPLAKPLRAAEVLAARGAMAQAQRIASRLGREAGSATDELDRRRLLRLEARLAIARADSAAAGRGAGDTAAAAELASAVQALEEILAIDPLDGDALMLLGRQYSLQQEPDRAILCFERAAGLEAYELNARIRHAQVLVSLGRYADAVPLLRRAQELKPRDDVARYLEQVERMARARR
jgi:tetratricopeptide (TPR) repeat protein